MLVNLTPSTFTLEPGALFTTLSEDEQEEIKRIGEFKKLQDGIYEVRHWNPECVFEELKNQNYGYWPDIYLPDRSSVGVFCFKYIPITEEFAAYDALLKEQGLPSDFNCYGVCDYPQQVLEKYPSLATCKDNFVITVVRLLKEDEPADGGWRWHKWGPYIGKQNPQCEYLADEPVIEEAFTFHIYHI